VVLVLVVLVLVVGSLVLVVGSSDDRSKYARLLDPNHRSRASMVA
jgi:hypothetical protein